MIFLSFLKIYQKLFHIFSSVFFIPLEDSKTRFLTKSGGKKQILNFSKNFEQFRFFDNKIEFFEVF